jgi:hypothetical protein
VEVVEEPLENTHARKKGQACAECAQWYVRHQMPVAGACRAECARGRAHEVGMTPSSYWEVGFGDSQCGGGATQSSAGGHGHASLEARLWGDD